LLRPLEERYPERTIVKLSDGRRVALPPLYNGKAGRERWEALSLDARNMVVNATVSFRYFFHYVYLPVQSRVDREVWPKELPRHWGEVCDDIMRTLPPAICPFDKAFTRNDGVYRMSRIWPTSTGKSLILVRAFPLYLIFIDPNLTCLLGTSTKTLGERHVANHQFHLTMNEIYLGLVGIQHDVRSPRVWRADKICVDGKLDESSGNVEVFGYGGAVEGVRFDVGVTDDVVTIENSKTESSRLAVYNWMTTAFHSRLHPDRRMWINIGTIHHATDAHSRIADDAKQKGNWDVKVYRMVDDTKPDCPWPPKRIDESKPWTVDNVVVPDNLSDYLLWPEFWTPRKVVEDYHYCSADGQLRPDGSLKPLLSAWDCRIGIPSPGTQLYDQYAAAGIEIGRRVISIDPASKVSKPGAKRDYTVIELWGMDKRSKSRILLDLLRFQTSSPKRFIGRLREWILAYRPHFVVFESNAMALWTAVSIEESLGIPVTKRALGPSKLEEIQRFVELAESGLLLYPWAQDGYTRRKMQPFEEELEGYPDEAEHDDTLMAAIHAYSKLQMGELDGVRVHVFGSAFPSPDGGDEEATGNDENTPVLDEWFGRRLRLADTGYDASDDGGWFKKRKELFERHRKVGSA